MIKTKPAPSTAKRKNVQNLTIYMGSGDQRQERIDRLDSLAFRLYGDIPGARSRLIQDLADGVYDARLFA